MKKELTHSNIERQNILNNGHVLIKEKRQKNIKLQFAPVINVGSTIKEVLI